MRLQPGSVPLARDGRITRSPCSALHHPWFVIPFGCPKGGGLLPRLFTLTRLAPGGIFSVTLSVNAACADVAPSFPGADYPVVSGLSSPRSTGGDCPDSAEILILIVAVTIPERSGDKNALLHPDQWVPRAQTHPFDNENDQHRRYQNRQPQAHPYGEVRNLVTMFCQLCGSSKSRHRTQRHRGQNHGLLLTQVVGMTRNLLGHSLAFPRASMNLN